MREKKPTLSCCVFMSNLILNLIRTRTTLPLCDLKKAWSWVHEQPRGQSCCGSKTRCRAMSWCWQVASGILWHVTGERDPYTRASPDHPVRRWHKRCKPDGKKVTVRYWLYLKQSNKWTVHEIALCIKMQHLH